MTRLSFLLYNFVRPLGRAVLGCSAGLKGNGMCFTAELLTEFPWSSFSLNEDVEYGLELLLKGVTVQFAPEAKLFAKMPHNVENARSQRVRWEAGRFPVIWKYSLKLLTAAFSRHSFKLFDAFVELMTPSLVNMLAVRLSTTPVISRSSMSSLYSSSRTACFGMKYEYRSLRRASGDQRFQSGFGCSVRTMFRLSTLLPT